MRNIKLNDHEWKKIQAFLRIAPQVKMGSARQCRRFVEAVVWILRSGAQWRLLPPEYGKWNSVYKRFARWCEAGVWEALFEYVASDPDMENVMVDSTIVRAHPCAAGAQKKRRTGEAGLGTQ
jgi:transposase